MRSTARLKILLNLVMTGQAKVIQAVLDCKGDEEKVDVVLEKYTK